MHVRWKAARRGGVLAGRHVKQQEIPGQIEKQSPTIFARQT